MRGQRFVLSSRSLREALRAWSAQVEAPLVRVLARLGISPNAVTLVGLALTAPAAYWAATGRWMWAGGGFIVAGLADLVDGALARRTGRASPFGAFLDSLVDRLQEAGLLLGILVFYAVRGLEVGVILTFLALVGSFLVSYARARAEGLGVPRSTLGLLTRPERVVILSAGLLTGWLLPALGVVAGLGLLTALQRTLEVWRFSRRRL